MQSLHQQISKSFATVRMPDPVTPEMAADNKNTAFHFSYVSHKGRSLQFLLTEIADADKTLIFAKAKRETPFTKNRSPNTSILRGGSFWNHMGLVAWVVSASGRYQPPSGV